MADLFRTLSSDRVRIHCSSGEKEFPIFQLNDDGEVVESGKMENIDAKIQSFKDEVLLENIIKRCSVTGETLEAAKQYFGDSRVLPKSMLEAKIQQNNIQGFVDSLSENDLSLLNEKGFDAFLSSKIEALKSKPQEVKQEVSDNE